MAPQRHHAWLGGLTLTLLVGAALALAALQQAQVPGDVWRQMANDLKDERDNLRRELETRLGVGGDWLSVQVAPGVVTLRSPVPIAVRPQWRPIPPHSDARVLGEKAADEMPRDSWVTVRPLVSYSLRQARTVGNAKQRVDRVGVFISDVFAAAVTPSTTSNDPTDTEQWATEPTAGPYPQWQWQWRWHVTQPVRLQLPWRTADAQFTVWIRPAQATGTNPPFTVWIIDADGEQS